MDLYLYNLFFFVWIVLMYYYWENFFYFLILIEGMMLSLLMLLVFFLSNSFMSFEFVFLFLSMMVIEGSFGLIMMVKLMINLGNHLFFIMNFF